MTEGMDPFAFFDQLAATSQSISEHGSVRSSEYPSKLLSNSPSLETIKNEESSVPEDTLDKEAFIKKWTDFTKNYRAEREGIIIKKKKLQTTSKLLTIIALYKHLRNQFTALERLDETFNETHVELHGGIMKSYKETLSNITNYKEHLNSEQKQFEKEKMLLKGTLCTYSCAIPPNSCAFLEIRKFQDEKVLPV